MNKCAILGASLLLFFISLESSGASRSFEERETADAPTEIPDSVDSKERSLVVDRICELIQEAYFPKSKIQGIADRLRQRLMSGAYDEINDGRAFAEILNADVKAASDDSHLRIAYVRSDTPKVAHADRADSEEAADAAAGNFGFAGAEWLPGNVGYLDIRAFVPLKFASATASAAMTFIAHTDALVIDLRQNVGGDPETIAFLTSYLLDKKTHLTDIQLRDSKTFESWTLERVPGEKFGEKKPIFLLTSRRTGSGGEQFAYNLQVLKRAVVVGESTRGQAHSTVRRAIDDRFTISIPNGEAKNPVTQTNWDGSGVIASVKVPQDMALETAYRQAVDGLIQQEKEGDTLQYLKAVRERIR